MAVNRRFLYVGLFLVALGAVIVAVQLAAVDAGVITSALRLWPLALVAIGFGLALRRSRYALVAGILGAMVPGLVLGGGLAVAPQYSSECGTRSDLAAAVTRQGTLQPGAAVNVTIDCGELTLNSRLGTDWAVNSQTTNGRVPIIEASTSQLTVTSSGDDGWLDAGRENLTLTLPSSRIDDLSVRLSAGRSTMSLAGADLGNLDLVGNAADVSVDGTGATLDHLDATLNFGRFSMVMPPGAYSGSVRVNAGQVRLCLPFGLGARVDVTGQPREMRANGAVLDGDIWQNDTYGAANNSIDLHVRVNFGSLLINPIGGCK